jgi:hypothetical protein
MAEEAGGKLRFVQGKGSLLDLIHCFGQLYIEQFL